MKLKACERCGKRTAEGLALCPDCMKESGAAAEAVAAAEELRDIARVLSITAGTDTNIREAMTGILHIADRLEGGMGEQQKMTIEEAIAILDPETRRAALFGYRYFGGFRGSEAVLAATEEACRVAVRVMREYLEKKGGEPT